MIQSSFLKPALLALAALITLGFTSLDARADAPVYEQLRNLFESGSLPTENDLTGWRSGRCYHTDQPYRPWNGLMVGWVTQGPDHGPISTRRSLKTLPVYWANGAPGIFDVLTPQVEQGVERFLDREAPMVAAVSMDERTMFGTYIHRHEQQWALRKVQAVPFGEDGPTPNPGPQPNPQPGPEPTPAPQDYIVARMSGNGYVVQYCYYFKVVR